MYCEKCGKQITASAVYCKHCGQKIIFEHEDCLSDINCKKETVVLETTNGSENTCNNKETKDSSSSTGGLSIVGFVIAIATGKGLAKSYYNDPVAHRYIEHIGGGLLSGAVCGIIPFFLSHQRKAGLKKSNFVSWGSFLFCTVAGLVGGLTFAIPASICLTIIIWYMSKKEGEKEEVEE
ncbi:MAG: zinc-ribbon domain [Firmicutes bacterium]|nr:zinc-ribbon domain [Bacillota bacterium]